MEKTLWSGRTHHLGLPLSTIKYTLSPTRLFLQRGLFTTVTEELNLFRVRDMRVTRTLSDKLFGTGTITLFSSDRSTPQLDMKHIKKPMEVKEMMAALVAEERNKRRPLSPDGSEVMGGILREFDDD